MGWIDDTAADARKCMRLASLSVVLSLLALLFAVVLVAGCTMGQVYSGDNSARGKEGISVPIFAPWSGCKEKTP